MYLPDVLAHSSTADNRCNESRMLFGAFGSLIGYAWILYLMKISDIKEVFVVAPFERTRPVAQRPSTPRVAPLTVYYPMLLTRKFPKGLFVYIDTRGLPGCVCVGFREISGNTHALVLQLRPSSVHYFPVLAASVLHPINRRLFAILQRTSFPNNDEVKPAISDAKPLYLFSWLPASHRKREDLKPHLLVSPEIDVGSTLWCFTDIWSGSSINPFLRLGPLRPSRLQTQTDNGTSGILTSPTGRAATGAVKCYNSLQATDRGRQLVASPV